MKLLYKLAIGFVAVVLLLVVLAFGCVYLLESFGPGIAASRINAMTGFRVEVGNLRISLIHASVRVENLVIKNPEGWPEEGFIDVKEALVDVAPLSFISGDRKVIDDMVLDLGPVDTVTNRNGEKNSKVFISKLTGEKKDTEEKKAEESRKFLISHLSLKATSVRYADYSGPVPLPVTIPTPLHIEMNNVTDLGQIADKFKVKLDPKSFLNKMLKSVQWSSGVGVQNKLS
jgi:hypothetical protein